MKTRFAPSPTGYLHMGNLRTAFFSYLLAKSQQGHFLLRIEDTDKSRSDLALVDALQEDLHWFGLAWEEGLVVEGPNRPYFQSQRYAIYNSHYKHLIEKNLAYLCFCTDQELAVMRKVQLSSGQPPRYAGTCRHLSVEEIAEKQKTRPLPVLRFRVSDQQIIRFTDFIRGEQTFLGKDIGDFIIRRADGGSSFFFCNAIDDSLMGITHVLRAEDHLTNTPRQIMILQALGLRVPEYGHISLIVESNKNPLSKRHGSCSVKVFREKGYLPLALQNYLARLGHHLTNNHCMSLTQLINHFSVSALSKSPAHFDEEQLLFWQKQALLQLDSDVLWKWLNPETRAIVPSSAKENFIALVKANIYFPQDALQWAKILFTDPLDIKVEIIQQLKKVDSAVWKITFDTVKCYGADFKQVNKAIQQHLMLQGKSLIQPLRMILTGRSEGPEMTKIFDLLGADKIQQRLQRFSFN